MNTSISILRDATITLVMCGLVGPACYVGDDERRMTSPPVRLGADRPSVTRIRQVLHVRRQEGGSLRFEVQRHTSRQLRSRRALASAVSFLFESPLSRLRDLRAYINGRRLPRRYIERQTIERKHIFVDDARIYRIQYPATRLGDRISHRYRRRVRQAALLSPVILPNAEVVDRFELVVNHPADLKVRFARWSPRVAKTPTITRSATRSTFSWRDLKQRPALPYYAFNGLRACVWPILSGAKGNLQPSTPQTHTRWYRSLYSAEPRLSPAQSRLVKRLVAGATSPRQKVAALHKFVRKQVRYIADERGLGRLVPRSARRVLERRWGDCKDKANLLMRLGREVGVTIDPVLVGVRHKPHFGSRIHTMQFDHMIASFADAAGRVFFDPTAADVPFGQLPEMDVDKFALVLHPTHAQALRLPAPPQKPSLELWLRGRASERQAVGARIVARNGLLQRIQQLARRYRGDALRTRLQRLLSGPVTGLSLRQLKLKTLTDHRAELEALADLSAMIFTTPQGYQLPTAPFGWHSDKLLERQADAWPVFLGSRPHLLLNLRLEAVDYRIAPQQRSISLGAKGLVRYAASLKQVGQALEARYFLRVWQKRFEGRDKDSLLRFHRAYQAARGRRASLRRSGS